MEPASEIALALKQVLLFWLLKLVVTDNLDKVFYVNFSTFPVSNQNGCNKY